MNPEKLAFLRDHVSTIDGQRPERLEEIRGRIRAMQHRRRVAAAIGAATATLAAAVVLLVGTNRAEPTKTEPVGVPRPDVPGGEVLAPDPFMHNNANGWHVLRQFGAPAPQLLPCIRVMSTWGATALKAESATYTGTWLGGASRANHARVNEYLLQYADRAKAHRAFLDAFHQLKTCRPADPNAGPPAIQRPSGPVVPDYDENFAQQRGGPHQEVYVLRVARAGNVLVVVEDTGIPSDQTPATQSVAVDQALPLFKKDPTYYAPATARADLPGWFQEESRDRSRLFATNRPRTLHTAG